MEQLPQYVVALLDNIAKAERFTDYSIELQPGSKHGDGFVGVMVSVALSGPRIKNNATTHDKLHLLCKLAPDNPARREAFMSDVVFTREVLAYDKVLPLFAEFQREKGLAEDECFTAYPKCYAAICDVEKGEYVLIMEDLRPKQYVMWSKKIPFTAQHSFAVVEQMAKFHAISFALRDQRPEVLAPFKQLDEVLVLFFEKGSMGNMLQNSYDRALGVLTDEKHIKIVKDLKLRMLETLKECFEDDVCEPYGAISHGDCWINNMLFQYNKEQTDQLDKVCFVDWQVLRYASPAIELHYNVFSSTDKEFRQKEYKNLMQHYHKSLSTAIRRMGSDPEKLYPIAAFEQDLKKFGKFAFAFVPIMVQMMLADPADIPDLDDFSEGLQNGDQTVDFVSGDFDEETQKIYSKRMIDVFTDLIELDYYWK